MDFVTVREFRTEPGKVWQKLEAEKELVITKNGKPFALLTATMPNTLEDDLKALRRARAITAVEAIRRRAAERGLDKMTLDEINAEVAAARKEKMRK